MRLETLARRGRRMSPHGSLWVADRIEDQAAKALTDLRLNRIRPGAQSASATRQGVKDAFWQPRHLAAQLPNPPWQAQSVRMDAVDFAMWSTTVPDRFAAVLDYGPVILAAWGTDLDAWDRQLTAASPDAVWPLISGTIGAG